MRRWGLMIALILSLGVNAGILATLALSGGDRSPGAESGPAGSNRPPGGPHGRPAAGPPGEPRVPELAAQRLERLADDLGLAGADRERFLELQRGMLGEGLRLARERFRLQAELRRELLADEPDRERVDLLIGEIAAVFTRLEQSTASAILDTRELLDPEQERRYLVVVAQIRPRLLRQAEQALRRRSGERWRRDRPGAQGPDPRRPPPLPPEAP